MSRYWLVALAAAGFAEEEVVDSAAVAGFMEEEASAGAVASAEVEAFMVAADSMAAAAFTQAGCRVVVSGVADFPVADFIHKLSTCK